MVRPARSGELTNFLPLRFPVIGTCCMQYRSTQNEERKSRQAALTLNAKNTALASTSHCSNCAASGVAFQVIFVSRHGSITINADNEATATSDSCANCSALAAAYQIIYAANQPGLSRYQVVR